MSSKKDKKLLDEVKDVLRLKHYSIHTERCCCDWIKKFVLFHRMTSRLDLVDGEQKIEQFLTDLYFQRGHLVYQWNGRWPSKRLRPDQGNPSKDPTSD